MSNKLQEITAEQAAELFFDGTIVGFSGFTPAGAAKAIPTALGARAAAEHAAGKPLQIGVITGASTGPSLDGALAEADAIKWRTPYQSDPALRKRINAGQTKFFDMHLSMLPQNVRYGFFGNVDFAVVEACDVNDNGEIVLTTSVGASPTFLTKADKILIELNEYHPQGLRGFHDNYEPEDPPTRREVPIYTVKDRIGSEVVKVDPAKIAGVVRTNIPDEVGSFTPPDDVTNKIGENVANFLAAEMKAGRIPDTFLPIQSGVGNIANAVLGAIGANPDIPPFDMYSEVIQDSVIELMRNGDLNFASGTSLTVSQELLKEIYENLDFYRDRMVLRPQEITNHPEVVRRLGVISINTAIEVDLFGNVNSTHVLGKNLMNGIGGSGDFTRSAYISIFTCPSLAKKGNISPVVPLVSHIDHSEHSVQVLVTEQGVADLRGKDPHQRAKLIVEQCAHPDFREELDGYFHYVKDGHTPQTLGAAFAMHQKFLETGNMRDVNWRDIIPEWDQDMPTVKI